MSVPISVDQDDRVQRILADPESYFAAAKKRIRAEVEEEMKQERAKRR